jgi:protein gp37
MDKIMDKHSISERTAAQNLAQAVSRRLGFELYTGKQLRDRYRYHKGKKTKVYSSKNNSQEQLQSLVPGSEVAEFPPVPDPTPKESPKKNSNPTKSVFNETNENIEWARWTWNPVTGCKHGCEYCYARDIANRFPENFPKGFEPDFRPERLAAPKNTKLPKNPTLRDKGVFVCSMADLFGEWVPQEWIDRVLEVVKDAPQWNFLFLTKNPQRLTTVDWPKNAWVGATVDVQARVKPTEEAFKKIKATVKFVSCEPLLEPLKFSKSSKGLYQLKLFDWVIIGSQSKTTKLPANQPDRNWVFTLITQAYGSGCKVYCKPNLTAGIKEYPII